LPLSSVALTRSTRSAETPTETSTGSLSISLPLHRRRSPHTPPPPSPRAAAAQLPPHGRAPLHLTRLAVLPSSKRLDIFWSKPATIRWIRPALEMSIQWPRVRTRRIQWPRGQMQGVWWSASVEGRWRLALLVLVGHRHQPRQALPVLVANEGALAAAAQESAALCGRRSGGHVGGGAGLRGMQ
jgi:hypothetical protein